MIQRPAGTREAPSPSIPPSPPPSGPPITNTRPQRSPYILRSRAGYFGGQCGNGGEDGGGEHLCPGIAHGGLCIKRGGGESAPHPLVCNTRVCAARSRFALAMGAHLLNLYGAKLFGIDFYSGFGAERWGGEKGGKRGGAGGRR